MKKSEITKLIYKLAKKGYEEIIGNESSLKCSLGEAVDYDEAIKYIEAEIKQLEEFEKMKAVVRAETEGK